MLVKTHARTEGEEAKSPNKERAQGRQNSWDYKCYNAVSIQARLLGETHAASRIKMAY